VPLSRETRDDGPTYQRNHRSVNAVTRAIDPLLSITDDPLEHMGFTVSGHLPWGQYVASMSTYERGHPGKPNGFRTPAGVKTWSVYNGATGSCTACRACPICPTGRASGSGTQTGQVTALRGPSVTTRSAPGPGPGHKSTRPGGGPQGSPLSRGKGLRRPGAVSKQPLSECRPLERGHVQPNCFCGR
jgi:hypothetical protein